MRMYFINFSKKITCKGASDEKNVKDKNSSQSSTHVNYVYVVLKHEEQDT